MTGCTITCNLDLRRFMVKHFYGNKHYFYVNTYQQMGEPTTHHTRHDVLALLSPYVGYNRHDCEYVIIILLEQLIEDGIKIWLEGSHASSTKRMQTRDNMSSENAYEITKSRFDKNKALYKKLYGFSFGDDKAVFDVIINTDNLTANQVIDVTTETVRKLL